jgi:hypothetical protein
VRLAEVIDDQIKLAAGTAVSIATTSDVSTACRRPVMPLRHEVALSE